MEIITKVLTVTVFVCGIILFCIWAVWKFAYITGRHDDRMLVLDVISELKYEKVKQLSVFEAQGLLLDKLKEAWDNSDKKVWF